jgi:protein TonB
MLRRGVRPLRQVRPVYPAQALQDEIEGEVLARATIGRDGRVHSVSIVSARPRGVFERTVEAALRQYEFPPDEQEYVVEVPFSFRLE